MPIIREKANPNSKPNGLPLVISLVFVDTMIVGKYLGVTALAALGATEWLVFVMFGCVQGITQGFSISMAKRFGSHDEEEL